MTSILFGGKKKKSNNMLIIIVILLCCCCFYSIISSSIGGYFMMNKSKSPDSTSAPPIPPSPSSSQTDFPNISQTTSPGSSQTDFTNISQTTSPGSSQTDSPSTTTSSCVLNKNSFVYIGMDGKVYQYQDQCTNSSGEICNNNLFTLIDCTSNTYTGGICVGETRTATKVPWCPTGCLMDNPPACKDPSNGDNVYLVKCYKHAGYDKMPSKVFQSKHDAQTYINTINPLILHHINDDFLCALNSSFCKLKREALSPKLLTIPINTTKGSS